MALNFIHERGIAHLDVKPDNIYVKNGMYKLGDFGCATLMDRSLPIEEGDARYMPQEILNDNYEHLDKVDIFSLGASILELVKGSPLPDSGPQLLNLREGKIPLLPAHSMQFQNLVKVTKFSLSLSVTSFLTLNMFHLFNSTHILKPFNAWPKLEMFHPCNVGDGGSRPNSTTFRKGVT